MAISLIRFEFVKLLKSPIYLAIWLFPMVYLFILLSHFKWNYDQSILSGKSFVYQGDFYSHANPYYHFAAQMLSGLFLFVYPLQSLLAMGYSRMLDHTHNGWMLIRSMGHQQWNWYCSGFLVNLTLIICSWLLNLSMLLSMLRYLPNLLPHLEYINFINPAAKVTKIFLTTLILSVPMLMLHQIIVLLSKSLSFSVIVLVLLIVITYSVYHSTPYYLVSKWIAEGLYALQSQLVLGHSAPLNISIFEYREGFAICVQILAGLLLVHFRAKV